MRLGDMDVLPLVDGTCRLPPAFYVGLDFDRHPELLEADGKVHIPIGCYLIRHRGRTTLIDAGLGPRQVSWATGGDLPAQLAAHGVGLDEIDTVVATHLHLDHVGWLAPDGPAYFPNATIRFGEADWDQFVTGADDDDPTRLMMEALADAGRLEPMSGDQVDLAPGMTARHTPGHTLGHYGLVLSSGDDRAWLLGDAIECPLQLAEDDFHAISDVDPDLARRTREAVWRELEGTATLVGAAHFPGLSFGRVMAGHGKRWFGPA